MAMQSGKEASASPERLWREQVSQLVDANELQTLAEPSLLDTVTAIGLLWVEVAVLLTAANLLPRLTLALSIPAGILIVLLMGLRMNAFGVILHEGSHGLLAKSRLANDRISNWGIAFWTINSVEEYRPTHRLHHRYLGQERDPDRVFYLVPARRGALTSLLLQDLFGITAFRRATSRVSGTSDVSGAPASLLARPQLLVGKIVAAIDNPRAVRPLSGCAAGGVVLRGLLARPHHLHVPDDSSPEDDHRTFRLRLASSKHRQLDRPDQLRRVAAESPRWSQNGIPLRTPCPSDHSVSRIEEAAPATGPDRSVHTPRRSPLAWLCPVLDPSGHGQFRSAADTSGDLMEGAMTPKVSADRSLDAE